MEATKQCPFCAETIKAQAVICWHCHTHLSGVSKDKKGKFVRIKLKTRDKIYYGEVYVPSSLSRVSDVINDERQFISLSHTKEETKTSEIPIGFIAINKNVIEWIRLLDKEQEQENKDPASRPLYE